MQHQRHLHHNNIASHTPRLPFYCQGNASHNSWITVPPASQLHWHVTLTPATGALLRHQFAVRTGRAWRVRPPPFSQHHFQARRLLHSTATNWPLQPIFLKIFHRSRPRHGVLLPACAHHSRQCRALACPSRCRRLGHFRSIPCNRHSLYTTIQLCV